MLIGTVIAIYVHTNSMYTITYISIRSRLLFNRLVLSCLYIVALDTALQTYYTGRHMGLFIIRYQII